MYIDTLNAQLGNNIGWVPDRFTHGKPMPQYRWAWTPELLYGGMCNGKMQPLRLHESDRWAIAKWEPPISEGEWHEKYGELQYPHGGMWVVTDFVLRPNVEPTEALTNGVIGAIKRSRSAKFNDMMDMAREREEYAARASRNQINDLIDDACLTYDAIPGTRSGSRSFGGIE